MKFRQKRTQKITLWISFCYFGLCWREMFIVVAMYVGMRNRNGFLIAFKSVVMNYFAQLFIVKDKQ